jgi:putative membrane-bound dehydrogenase-like protein
MFRVCQFVLLACLSGASLLLAAAAQDTPILITPDQEKALLKEVRIPEGFAATIFAKPPEVNYPVFVSAAVDGTVYVSSDRNGSLDRAQHRGRVLRVRDTDGDGHADEVKQFVPDVDSPRGLVWDRDRLYLLHPPHLSVYFDRNGDGIADEEKILVKNIAFGFKDRPADHSSNGLELGVDGWIYCAIGDFGFMEAEGTDGRKLQLRGGGVVRVRPDGTGLELFSHGTRNILEVAVSPLLDTFARDNTNDGDGWDIRFHHFVGGSEHGYPSLFKNFKGEFIEPLADYGGGSGCGALFLSEPGFPAGYNDCVYTADWGREWVYRHHPVAQGATFKIDQSEFVRAPRVTDLDVDGSSHLYVASWKGASFTYVGENVGFLVQLKPNGYTPELLPDFGKADPKALIALLDSPSHRRRLEAQRELILRGLDSAAVRALETVAATKAKNLPTRVAALFALKQAQGKLAARTLVKLANDSALRPFAIRALTDRLDEIDPQFNQPILHGLADPDPKVRRESSFALARLGDRKLSQNLIPLLNDADPIVAHSAVQALKKLDASDTAFKVVDASDSSETARVRALYVLQSLHKSAVVTGLIDRLQKEKVPARRAGLLTALCRLHFTDGIWKGDSWGTRPDTTGPYYQPATWEESARIAAFLKASLETGAPEEAGFLVKEFARHKLNTSDTLDTVIRLAEKDEALLPPALATLARADKVPSEALTLLTRAAKSEKLDDVSLAYGCLALGKIGNPDAIRALLGTLPRLEGTRAAQKEFASARDYFLNTARLDEAHDVLESEAAKLDQKLSPWADAALLKLMARKNASPEAREAALKAVENGWNDPARKAQLLKAAALASHRDWRDRILSSMDDSNEKVAAAARQTAQTLRLNREPRRRPAQTIEKLPVSEVVSSVMQTHGEIKTGEDLFTRQGCVNCHTVAADQALRGPFLGNIATIYKRNELAEAILLPNKTIAQGFATHHFELKDGTEVDGFVTQEGAETVKIRTVTAQEMDIKTNEVAKRTKVEKSLMPDGLAANLTLQEFAALLDYLEGLAKK